MSYMAPSPSTSPSLRSPDSEQAMRPGSCSTSCSEDRFLYKKDRRRDQQKKRPVFPKSGGPSVLVYVKDNPRRAGKFPAFPMPPQQYGVLPPLPPLPFMPQLFPHLNPGLMMLPPLPPLPTQGFHNQFPNPAHGRQRYNSTPNIANRYSPQPAVSGSLDAQSQTFKPRPNNGAMKTSPQPEKGAFSPTSLPQTSYPPTSYPQTSMPQTSMPQTAYPQTSFYPTFYQAEQLANLQNYSKSLQGSGWQAKQTNNTAGSWQDAAGTNWQTKQTNSNSVRARGSDPTSSDVYSTQKVNPVNPVQYRSTIKTESVSDQLLQPQIPNAGMQYSETRSLPDSFPAYPSYYPPASRCMCDECLYGYQQEAKNHVSPARTSPKQSLPAEQQPYVDLDQEPLSPVQTSPSFSLEPELNSSGLSNCSTDSGFSDQKFFTAFKEEKSSPPPSKGQSAERLLVYCDNNNPTFSLDAESLSHVMGMARNIGQYEQEFLEEKKQIRKKIPCRNLSQTGACQFGENCWFSHDTTHYNLRH